MNQQLGSYVKFFHIIRDLNDCNQIDSKQKQLLKVNFTTKEKKLMTILNDLNDEDEEEIKYSLLSYLNDLQKEKPILQRQMKRTRSSITDVALLKGVVLDETKNNDTFEDIDKAYKLINHLLQKKREGIALEPKVNEIFENIQNLFIPTSPQQIQSPQLFVRRDSLSYDINQQAESELLEAYRNVKFQFANYMTSHLLLMDENVSYNTIFSLLRELTKNLLDCDHFSFYLITSTQQLDLYQTKTDSFDQISITEIISQELQSIPQNSIFRFAKDSSLCSQLISNNNLSSYGFYANDVIFIYHLKQDRQDNDSGCILKIANDYQLQEEINNLSFFLLQTIQNAKVQFFSPLSIADMILDLGISFVRASKFVLIEQMYNILSTQYKVDKLYTDQPDITIWDPESVYIIFKDYQVTVFFRVYQMNLKKQSDQRLYSEVKHYYEKYLRFIRQCFDKSAFYKFFLRSNDSLIFEFDKSGHLIFLSRPIPSKIKINFNIQFNAHMIHQNLLSYNKIFDQDIISNIENFLQDQKWKMMKDSDKQQYEIFLKIEEKTYKGFAVIFTENIKGWVKEQFQQLESGNGLDSKLKAKIRKQLIQHETQNFVNKLEETNPEVKNSVASLYMPLSQAILKRSKSIRDIVNQQEQPKMRKTEMPQRSKFQAFFHQQEFDLNNFSLDNQDDLLETFEFNIMDLQTQIQKHKVVWAILKKDGALEDYQIPYDALQNFIKEMEHHYNINKNPFHNYDHGVTVMQTAHYFCTQLQQTKNNQIIDKFERFTLMISSYGHDVGHTGKTNLFEINSLSDLAIRYHDKSVLEQHHAALTILILKNPQSNILVNLNQQQFRNFRKGLIANILSTDMSEHFSLLKDFENRPKDFRDSKILSGYIMHTSDFGGAGKKTQISVQWSARVNQEFIAQYKLEGELGYPQQSYMKDLHIPHIMAQSEIGFLKVIVRPCYALLSEFLENKLRHCIQNIDETIQYWEKQMKKGDEQQ